MFATPTRRRDCRPCVFPSHASRVRPSQPCPPRDVRSAGAADLLRCRSGIARAAPRPWLPEERLMTARRDSMIEIVKALAGPMVWAAHFFFLYLVEAFACAAHGV